MKGIRLQSALGCICIMFLMSLTLMNSNTIVTDVDAIRLGESKASLLSADSELSQIQTHQNERDETAEPIDWNEQPDEIKNPVERVQNLTENGNIENDWEDLPEWVRILVCVVGIIIALVEIFFGYRMWNFTVFMATGLLGFIAMFYMLVAAIPDDNEHKAAYVYGFSALMFVIVGSIFVIFRRAAVFVIGAMCGVGLAFYLQPIALRYIWPENPTAILWIFVVLFGIVFGVVTMYAERIIVILGTAVAGSLLLVLSIGGIAGHLPITNDFTDDPDSIPWQSWAYVIGAIVAVVMGFFIQYCVTARDEDHSRKGGYKRMN